MKNKQKMLSLCLSLNKMIKSTLSSQIKLLNLISFGFLVYVMYKKITKKSVDARIAFDEVDQGNVIVDWKIIYSKK